MKPAYTLAHRANGKGSVALEFRPKELCLGLRWNTYYEAQYSMVEAWFYILPMLAIHLCFRAGESE